MTLDNIFHLCATIINFSSTRHTIRGMIHVWSTSTDVLRAKVYYLGVGTHLHPWQSRQSLWSRRACCLALLIKWDTQTHQVYSSLTAGSDRKWRITQPACSSPETCKRSTENWRWGSITDTAADCQLLLHFHEPMINYRANMVHVDIFSKFFMLHAVSFCVLRYRPLPEHFLNADVQVLCVHVKHECY